MTDSERITNLEQQIVSLQAALSLVLSAEGRELVNSKDMKQSLKGLLDEIRSDEYDERQRALVYSQAQMQQAQIDVINARAQAVFIGTTGNTVDPYADLRQGVAAPTYLASNPKK